LVLLPFPVQVGVYGFAIPWLDSVCLVVYVVSCAARSLETKSQGNREYQSQHCTHTLQVRVQMHEARLRTQITGLPQRCQNQRGYSPDTKCKTKLQYRLVLRRIADIISSTISSSKKFLTDIRTGGHTFQLVILGDYIQSLYEFKGDHPIPYIGRCCLGKTIQDFGSVLPRLEIRQCSWRPPTGSPKRCTLSNETMLETQTSSHP
jgi:hypothetical protein